MIHLFTKDNDRLYIDTSLSYNKEARDEFLFSITDNDIKTIMMNMYTIFSNITYTNDGYHDGNFCFKILSNDDLHHTKKHLEFINYLQSNELEYYINKSNFIYKGNYYYGINNDDVCFDMLDQGILYKDNIVEDLYKKYARGLLDDTSDLSGIYIYSDRIRLMLTSEVILTDKTIEEYEEELERENIIKIASAFINNAEPSSYDCSKALIYFITSETSRQMDSLSIDDLSLVSSFIRESRTKRFSFSQTINYIKNYSNYSTIVDFCQHIFSSPEEIPF